VTPPDGAAPSRRSFFGRYFGSTAASLEAARRGLLSSQVTVDPHTGVDDRYRPALIEQYKIYVEMADRISARRAGTNTFFITINTGIFTLIGSLMQTKVLTSPWLLTFPLIAVLTECLAWFWLLRSYRQLNSAKYAVVGALEELLPVSPYWRAEWQALGEGKDPSRYLPLTHLEQWIPVAFAVTYLATFIAVVATA
jgi:hypothetical protein